MEAVPWWDRDHDRDRMASIGRTGLEGFSREPVQDEEGMIMTAEVAEAVGRDVQGPHRSRRRLRTGFPETSPPESGCSLSADVPQRMRGPIQTDGA